MVGSEVVGRRGRSLPSDLRAIIDTSDVCGLVGVSNRFGLGGCRVGVEVTDEIGLETALNSSVIHAIHQLTKGYYHY